MKERIHLPRARTDGLVINELTDEVLVYDLQRDQAHCLNAAAASVWKQCDGRTTVAGIARRLSEPGTERAVDATGSTANERDRLKSVPVDEAMVWLALDQLSRDHLLVDVSWPASLPRSSRREAIRRLGMGAAIAIPLIVTITAPTPAEAATCLAKGSGCGTGAQCCSKACVANKCA